MRKQTEPNFNLYTGEMKVKSPKKLTIHGTAITGERVNMEEDFWVTADGDTLYIPDMETSHLKNACKKIVNHNLRLRSSQYDSMIAELDRRGFDFFFKYGSVMFKERKSEKSSQEFVQPTVQEMIRRETLRTADEKTS